MCLKSVWVVGVCVCVVCMWSVCASVCVCGGE